MDLSFSGPATFGSDYTVSGTSLSFAALETTKIFRLTPGNDSVAEGAESIIVALDPDPLQTADPNPRTLALSMMTVRPFTRSLWMPPGGF